MLVYQNRAGAAYPSEPAVRTLFLLRSVSTTVTAPSWQGRPGLCLRTYLIRAPLHISKQPFSAPHSTCIQSSHSTPMSTVMLTRTKVGSQSVGKSTCNKSSIGHVSLASVNSLQTVHRMQDMMQWKLPNRIPGTSSHSASHAKVPCCNYTGRTRSSKMQGDVSGSTCHQSLLCFHRVLACNGMNYDLTGRVRYALPQAQQGAD